MEINKQNYEAFLLDLWEGSLSEEQKTLLYNFLEKHPELDEGDALDLLGDVSETIPDVAFDQESLNFESINEKNYEFFFIAYFEEDLSKSEMEHVDLFLSDHPELLKKFNQFKKARLSEENSDVLSNIEKETLDFENISLHNYQYFFIAYNEGDLSILQMKEIEAFVANHPELSKEFDQYKRAKLPHEEFTYPNKSLLLEDTTPIISLQSRWLLGIAAASVAMFFLFSSPLNGVENKYSMGNGKGLTIEGYELDPFKIETKKAIEGIENQEQKSIENTIYANHTNPKVVKREKENDSLDKRTNPKFNINSRKDIKAEGFSNVVASLSSNNSKKAEDEVPKNELNTQEKIPTILEYTTAYLQRKNVLNEERKPNLKGLLNNTLASSNNDQPVLESTQETGSKHTVFKLGDFKFERIAKK